ncbi:hypothetical protein JTB14_030776 [Gonioctena quinquepunctata]|nr:hypothetical protein JTB14_030776 [Gonioctena quinquepunctata]
MEQITATEGNKLFVNGKAYEAADLILKDEELETKTNTKPNSCPATPKTAKGPDAVPDNSNIQKSGREKSEKSTANNIAESNSKINKPITRQQGQNEPTNRRKNS